jgi:predicted nucleic acid-binding protein
MGLVLDTSIIVAAERGRFDIEKFLLCEAPGIPIYITSITASELLHGVHSASGAIRKKREAFVEDFIEQLSILPFDLIAARKHAELRANLDSIGKPIGPHDLIIAATCVALNHVIATLNVREFERVPNLDLSRTQPYEVEQAN